MFKKRLLVVVLLFILLSTLVGNAGAAPPDPLEPLESSRPDATPCPYPDQYEDDGGGSRDDTYATASTLTTAGQPGHTFDIWADKDWARFQTEAGVLYTIATTNLIPPPGNPEFYADTWLGLYEADGVTLIAENDDYGGTFASRIDWQAPQAGTYYVKIYNYNPGVYGCDVGYDLVLTETRSLDINKSAEDLNGAPLLARDVIRYTITVTNSDTAQTRTNVVITDAIPSGVMFVDGSVNISPIGPASTWHVISTEPVLYVHGTELQPLAGVVVRFDVRVDSGTVGQDIVNQAYVSSDQLSPLASPPATPPGPGGGQVAAGLVITKTALDLNGPPLGIGDTISYTVIVTNQHTTMSHTNVVITDPIPLGTTYVDGSASTTQGVVVLPVTQMLQVNVGTLGPSESVRVEFAVTVDGGVTLISGNVAAVKSDVQNTQSTGPVYPPSGGGVSSLAIYKEAEDVNGGPLYPGDEILYTVAVYNLLSTPQSGIVITDAIPDYTTYVADSASLTVGGASQGSVSGPDPLVADVGTLANQPAVLTFRVVVNGDAEGQVIQNSAQASSDEARPTSVGPIEPQPSGGTVQLGQQALGITKTAEDVNGGPLYPDDEILYTISVVNLLSEPQANVVITDAIPDYTTYVAGSASVSQGSVSGPDPLVANVGALQAGETVVLTFRVTVDAGATGQIIENSAQASSDDQSPPVVTPPIQPYPSPIPGDPGSGGGLVLSGNQQIGIIKAAADLNGAPLDPGDTIEYTIAIWNEIGVLQTNVVITDYIPAFTTYVSGSVTTTKGTPSGPDPLLVDVGTLGASEHVTVTFQVTVDQDARGQMIMNQAMVGSDQQVPQAYTPPGGGTVSSEHLIYLPVVMRGS